MSTNASVISSIVIQMLSMLLQCDKCKLCYGFSLKCDFCFPCVKGGYSLYKCQAGRNCFDADISVVILVLASCERFEFSVVL